MNDENGATRFSQIYLGTADRLQDSSRARVRVNALLGKMQIENYQVADVVEHELGVSVPYNGSWDFTRFITKCELRDFLDFISLVETHFSKRPMVAKNWLPGCRRIFSEERLRYTINDAGGVRFAADSNFEFQIQATIANLGDPRLKGAMQSFEQALDAMSGSPLQGKAAIRGVFEAVEIAFKTLCDGTSRIGESEIHKSLVQHLDIKYRDDQTARLVAAKIARSLAEWVNGAHFYRHGQVGHEPIEPPVETTIAMVSEGAVFLRWLATLLSSKLQLG